MKLSDLEIPVQSSKLVETPKEVSSIKNVDTVFETWDEMRPQLLGSLVLSMPERVLEEICKKMEFTLGINCMWDWKKCFTNDFPKFSYNGPLILTNEIHTIFCYVRTNLIKTDENHIYCLFESSCIFLMSYKSFRCFFAV